MPAGSLRASSTLILRPTSTEWAGSRVPWLLESDSHELWFSMSAVQSTAELPALAIVYVVESGVKVVWVAVPVASRSAPLTLIWAASSSTCTVTVRVATWVPAWKKRTTVVCGPAVSAFAWALR